MPPPAVIGDLIGPGQAEMIETPWAWNSCAAASVQSDRASFDFA
jgi:hypothetical protein